MTSWQIVKIFIQAILLIFGLYFGIMILFSF